MTDTRPRPRTVDEERQDIATALDYIAANIMEREDMAKVMAEAVRAGIQAAVADPALWAAAGMAMQAQAKQATGGWLLGGIKAIFSKASVVVMVLAGIYVLGGPSAVLAFVKALLPGGHQP